MSASKFCPFNGCIKKIAKKAKFCRAHTDYSFLSPPRTSWERQCRSCGELFSTTNPRGSRCTTCKTGICIICKTMFPRNGNYAPKACSKRCGKILAHQSSSRTRTSLICHYCQKAFYPANGHLKIKFCSKICRYTAARKPDLDRKRNSYSYRVWRDAVYTRDNFQCQHCGKIGGIQAHHIQSWHAIPALRYDVANGITLCQICHENIHGAKIPRVTKRFAPLCITCGRSTKGKAKRCRSCAMRLSPKAIAQRQARLRNKHGQYASERIEAF